VLDGYIDAQLDRYGLTDADLLLVGFSQGTMMALHVGALRAHPVAGIVGYSGTLADADLAGRALSHPPVLLIHGDADSVVPFAALSRSARALEGLGFAVETHVSRGLDHSVDPDGLRRGAAFARRVLGA
jgi:phospholipase/carboxylesterase